MTMRRNRNGVRFRSNEQSLGPIANTLTLVIIVAMMSLLYLSQVVKTSSLSYQVSDLEGKKSVLVEENQSLKIEAARLQSIERIRKSEVVKNFEQGGEVSYLEN